ncbi:MAG: 50S ribosomal protein L30 [Defluviitaleaceae bacterium]|nr:50S ribosomal protein L30 [Defluviitaleaceae bacterium]
MADLKITLVKSTIGAKPKHVRTVQALGLRKLHSHVVKHDNPAMRGMIEQVKHLIAVENAN